MQRPPLFEANGFIYWKNRFETYVKSKDIDLWHIIVYEVVLEKDSEASKNKKEKYKSLALKAKKESSEEESSSSDSEDEEYAMAVRDFKKLFRRRGSDCPKHYYNNQKALVGGSWIDSDEDLKKYEICLMAHESNEVHSDTLYYSSSSLDDETLQNEYNKLCKISLKVINKNKHLKTKNELLDKEVFELRERLKRLEINKGLNEECKSCLELRTKNESLASKLAKFDNSSHYLNELRESQRSPNNRKGLGFTDCKASTSEVKMVKTSENADKRASDVLDPEDPFERDPASAIEGIRAPDAAATKLKPSMQSRTNFVQITKKTSSSATVENTKQPPAL
ncbi:hypothetical protein Tco_1145816 [Tanacetum coccineum]